MSSKSSTIRVSTQYRVSEKQRILTKLIIKISTLMQSMRILIVGLLSFWGCQLCASEDAKPVALRIVIAGKPRLNVGVVWDNEGQNTDSNGEVTFERSWYEKRSKGKRIQLKIHWNGRDRALSYHTTIPVTLDYPVTIVDCPFEKLRKLEADAADELEKTRKLNARNKEIAKKMDVLEGRVVKHIEFHKESLVGLYEKWLEEHIAHAKTQQVQIETQLTDLDRLTKRLFENDVLIPEVKKEVQESESLQQSANPSIENMEKTLPEITLNLDSEPDKDFMSGILFDSGSDSLKQEAQGALNDFVNQKSKQLQEIMAREGGQARKRVCVLSLTGYADAKGLSNTVNNSCPPEYQDAEDGNLCLSWRRARTVQAVIGPLFSQNSTVDLKTEPPVGKGRKYALKDSEANQNSWRKCTISVIYMSADFYKAYVEVRQTHKD
jgi:outer membrane protein OmpA-like peptidoglycan-associated protein